MRNHKLTELNEQAVQYIAVGAAVLEQAGAVTRILVN